MFTKEYIEEILTHLEICGCRINRNKKIIKFGSNNFNCYLKLLKIQGYEQD